MVIFSERIRALREEKNLSQYVVAEELGIRSQTLSNYENGREPSYDMLLKIAKYFNCSVSFLLGLDEYRNINDEINQMEKMNDVGNILNGFDPDTRCSFLEAYSKFADGYMTIETSDIKSSFLYSLEHISLAFNELCQMTQTKRVVPESEAELQTEWQKIVLILLCLDGLSDWKKVLDYSVESFINIVREALNKMLPTDKEDILKNAKLYVDSFPKEDFESLEDVIFDQ